MNHLFVRQREICQRGPLSRDLGLGCISHHLLSSGRDMLLASLACNLLLSVTEKLVPSAKGRPQLPGGWLCKAMQRALMNIELAVNKLAFQKNVILKKFVGMQAHHVVGHCQVRIWNSNVTE